jgi:hypothetical protein
VGKHVEHGEENVVNGQPMRISECHSILSDLCTKYVEVTNQVFRHYRPPVWLSNCQTCGMKARNIINIINTPVTIHRVEAACAPFHVTDVLRLAEHVRDHQRHAVGRVG